MSDGGPECAHARLAIGGDPHTLPPAIVAHLATCTGCTRFREETLMLDGRLRAALELPLPQFRPARAAPPARRYALAASVALALLLAGGFWVLKPQPALADEVVAHVLEEGSSWDQQALLPPSAVADVLRTASVEFDASLPVVYAYACPFHGHRVPHMVVQTDNGPMTVMLLAHEKVSKRTEFSEAGLHGVLLPAGSGSVAVLMRSGELPEDLAHQIVSAARY
jgi:Protein of unknown function (DUF3379)